MEIGYDAVYSCSPSSRHTSFYFIKIFELIFINVKSFTQSCTIQSCTFKKNWGNIIAFRTLACSPIKTKSMT